MKMLDKKISDCLVAEENYFEQQLMCVPLRERQVFQSGFIAGAASRDAEIAKLTKQRDAAYKIADHYRNERDELLADAMRYRWLRLRIEVRNLRSMSGSARPAMEIRIGHAFFDTDTEPGRGYLDKNTFKNQCNLLDAAIDNARSTKPATANYPHGSLGEDVGAEGGEL